MSDIEQHDSSLGCFTQIFRTLVGPTLILVLGATIAANRTSLGGPLDFAFAGIVFLTILATVLQPRGSTQVSTQGARRPSARIRYALILPAASLATFVVAHFLFPKGG